MAPRRAGGSGVVTLSSNVFRSSGSMDSTIQRTPRMNTVANTASPYSSTPHARPIVSVESITTASFGSSIFGAIPDQVRGAHNAKRPSEAGADDHHHGAADDGEQDLRLDHWSRSRRRAASTRAECEERPEHRRKRQRQERVNDTRGMDLEEIGDKVSRAPVGVPRHPRAALRQASGLEPRDQGWVRSEAHRLRPQRPLRWFEGSRDLVSKARSIANRRAFVDPYGGPFG